MLTTWDLDEAVATVGAMREAVGEPVTWRHYEGMLGDPPQPVYSETEIRARFTPVPPGLISSGLYMKSDLQMVTSVEVVPGDVIVRFGDTYNVLDAPFVRRLSDRVVAYETKVRKA